MQDEKTYFNSVAILFIIVAIVAWVVWHSWFLYHAAIIAGYVALTLLTVILKSKMIFIAEKCPEQYTKRLAKLYSIALDNYAIICLSTLFAALFIAKHAGWGMLMIFANVGIAVIAFMFAMRWCEHKDWWRWFHKIVLEQS